MPKQTYNIETSHSLEHLFQVVSNIELYPEFLPWIVAARILSKKDNIIIAELVIKYKFFRSCYSSKVTLFPNQEIIVELVDGPFKYLKNYWRFTQYNNKSKIDFMLDFELKSSMLEKFISNEFDYYSKKIMTAFIERADKIR